MAAPVRNSASEDRWIATKLDQLARQPDGRDTRDGYLAIIRYVQASNAHLYANISSNQLEIAQLKDTVRGQTQTITDMEKQHQYTLSKVHEGYWNKLCYLNNHNAAFGIELSEANQQNAELSQRKKDLEVEAQMVYRYGLEHREQMESLIRKPYKSGAR